MGLTGSEDSLTIGEPFAVSTQYQRVTDGQTDSLSITCAVKLNKICIGLLAGLFVNKKDGYRQLNVRQLGSLRPWDHRSKCYMD